MNSRGPKRLLGVLFRSRSGLSISPLAAVLAPHISAVRQSVAYSAMIAAETAQAIVILSWVGELGKLLPLPFFRQTQYLPILRALQPANPYRPQILSNKHPERFRRQLDFFFRLIIA